jgi:hypothetical protein
VRRAVDRVSAGDWRRVGATFGASLTALASDRHAPGVHRNAPHGAPHRRLPVKARGGDDTLFAQPTSSALVEGMDAEVALSMLAHRRDVADERRCNQTCFKEHPVAAAIPDLPVAGPDPSSRPRASAARAAGSFRIFRAATRRGRRVGLGWRMQSGCTADRVWGSRSMSGGHGRAAPGRYRQPRLPWPAIFTPRLGHPCSSRRIAPEGAIRRDQDSAARNAPRCVHWSPGRLSPRGLDALAPPCAGGELRAATTERTSSRGRFRHVFHAHALRARHASVFRT